MSYWDPDHPKNLSDDALLVLRALWGMRKQKPIDRLYFTQAVTMKMAELEKRAAIFSLGQVEELLFQLEAAELLIRPKQNTWLVDVWRMFVPEAKEAIAALLGLPEAIVPPPSGERLRVSLLANRSDR